MLIADPNRSKDSKNPKGLKKYFRKVALASALLAPLLFILTTHSAHASWFDIGNIAGNAIGWVIFAISWLIATIVAIFIAVLTFFIGVILQLNGQVVNSLAVQSGFSVTLAVANLGFVIGIIVIAIMTIIRNETYGMKQILWKLVVAAILVNFSLVLAGVILNFSNLFTTYFMAALPGGGGGGSAYNSFSTALAGAFTSTGGGAWNATSSLPVSVAQDVGSNIAAIITPFFGLFFTLIMLAMILITLGVFFFMLLVRYIELSILLILMPLVWLFWVFPKLSHLWDKWWSEFIRWTFFAPIVMFFLYLAISTAQLMNKAHSVAGWDQLAPGAAANTFTSPTGNWLTGALGSLINTLAGNAMQMLVVIGLTVGGIIAADKMSITGAQAAIKSMKGESGFGKYLKNKGVIGARAGWQKSGGHKLASNLTQNQDFLSKKLGGIPLVGGFVRRGASLAGRGLNKIQTNKSQVEEAKKGVPSDITKAEWEARIKGNLNEQDMLAHVAMGTDKGWINADTEFNGKKIGQILDNKALIERNGAGKLKKDTDKTLLSSTEFREAETNGDQAAMAVEMKKIVKTSDAADLAKIDANAILQKDVAVGSPEDMRRQVQVEALAQYAPQSFAKLIPKMSSKSRDNLNSIFNERRAPVIQQEELVNTNAQAIETNEKLLAPIKERQNEISQEIEEAGKKAERESKDAQKRVGAYATLAEADVRNAQVAIYAQRDAEIARLNGEATIQQTAATPINRLLTNLQSQKDALNTTLKNLQASPAQAPWEKANKHLQRVLVNNLEGLAGGSGTT